MSKNSWRNGGGDHSTLNRWVITYSPHLAGAFHRRKRPVWVSWRMDETSIQVKGAWYFLYRAVDKHGHIIDFLLTAQRDELAAKRGASSRDMRNFQDNPCRTYPL